MADLTKEDLEHELAIIRALKEARLESDGRYALKFYEKVLIWLIGILAGGVVIAFAKIGVDALLKAVGQ